MNHDVCLTFSRLANMCDVEPLDWLSTLWNPRDVDIKLGSAAFFQLHALSSVARSTRLSCPCFTRYFHPLPHRKCQSFLKDFRPFDDSGLVIWTRLHLPSLSFTWPLFLFLSDVWLLPTNINYTNPMTQPIFKHRLLIIFNT